MINVYFDNVLVNPDYIYKLDYRAEVLRDSFKLGSTVCANSTLWVDNAVATPSVVTIKNDDVLMATFYVDNSTNNNNFYTEYRLVDSMVALNESYSWADLSAPTITNIVNDICIKYGVNAPGIVPNGSMVVDWYSDITARDFIGFVAELNGGYACITADNTLAFIPYFTTEKVVDTESCDDLQVGALHELTRVVYDNGVDIYQAGSIGGETVYLNVDNILFNGNIQAQVDAIYEAVGGHSFSNISVGKCDIDSSVRAGDTIAFGSIKSIANIDWELMGEWLGGYTLDLKTQEQKETEVVSDEQKKIRELRTIVDRTSGQLEIVAAETEETAGGIALLENHFIVRPDGVYVSFDGSLDNSAKILGDGFRVISDGSVVMEASKNIVECHNGLGVKGWAIVEGSDPRVLNIVRKG